METQTVVKMSKAEKTAFIRERDGNLCFICRKAFTRNDPSTIEHWIPRSAPAELFEAAGGESVENLRLTHHSCNSKKADLIPNADGTIPERVRPLRSHILKRENKKMREEICGQCNDGRLIGEGEVCEHCGSGPGPEKYPHYLKKKAPDCDHAEYWCWACSIGIIERRGALMELMIGLEDEEEE